MERLSRSALLALIAALALAACGGDSSGPASRPVTTASTSEPGAPQATGNTATDGFNWFNYRRQQAGLSGLSRNAIVDAAAQGHSEYQRVNDVITHIQDRAKPGFTGVDVGDRLVAAGYQFRSSYAYGEVLSATSDSSGFHAAEDLIAAIYHRFVIFEPVFRQAGTGSATVTRGATYFTANFVTDRLEGLGEGKLVTYPFGGQQRVPRNFFSDHEVPDPVPSRNEVGYPVSVHADITTTIGVQSFTIRPRGGAALPVLLLRRATDPETPASAAAIVPLDPLDGGTTYEVRFTGTVNGTAVDREWTFTTQ